MQIVWQTFESEVHFAAACIGSGIVSSVLLQGLGSIYSLIFAGIRQIGGPR